MESKRFSLRFKGSDRPDPAQIGEFLFLFRATYAAALQVNDGHNVSATMEGARELARKLVEHLKSLDARQLDRLFYQDLGRHGLATKRISNESPLEVDFVGYLVAIMAVALIIAGGKFKVAGIFEVELDRPLGDAIKKLRQGLARPTKAQIRYGVRSSRVRLSRYELKELFRQDRKQRERGGFQRFLVNLQDQANRQTGVLNLNGEDIDRIIRYGRQPDKGGFQRRLRKIFEKHLKFDK